MRRPPLALVALVALAGVSAGRPALASNDALFPSQWNLAIIGASSAWDRGGSGAGVTIGIVDTGIDAAQEDLRDQVVATVTCVGAGGSAAKCNPGGSDDNGHGTHVAGIAAARSGNGAGVAGVAPSARIVAAKVLKQDGTGDLNDVGAGIRWVVQQCQARTPGRCVVNLSLGIDDSSNSGRIATLSGTVLQNYITEAWNAGAVPVVSAGNGSSKPSNYNNVNAIVVTATTNTDTQARYASQTSGALTDAKYSMAAPGGEADGRCPGSAIVSTFWDPATARHDEYACMAGTSMAAPHVAGAAAVLLGLGLSRDDTVQRLLSTAKNIGPSSTFGSGRLDLAAATAGLGHPVATTAPPATTVTTRTARVRGASTARPPVTVARAAAAPTTTTTVPPPPPTTTTTEPASTTTGGTQLAAGETQSPESSRRGAAAVLAAAGVAVMGTSSVAALRRRRRFGSLR